VRIAEEVLQSLWRSDHVSARAVILVGNKVDLVRSRLVSTEGNFCQLIVNISFSSPKVTYPKSDSSRRHAKMEIVKRQKLARETRSLSIIEVAFSAKCWCRTIVDNATYVNVLTQHVGLPRCKFSEGSRAGKSHLNPPANASMQRIRFLCTVKRD